MLKDLDSVDWASLQHAYGSAADVPDLLRALAGDDDDAREEATSELFGNIHHQGTVYSASAAAVPFLYELLNSPVVPDRSSIACLLGCIAAGAGYLEVHAVGEYGERTWRGILAKSGKVLEDEIAREAEITQRVRRAASARLPDLLPYLRDPVAEIRRTVAEALGCYPEHAGLALPALVAAAQVETDDEVGEFLADSIARLNRA